MRTYPEPLVARVTGLKKRRIVGVRKASLTRGDDWQIERNVVHYTPAGIEKLLVALGLTSAGLVWPAETAAPAESPAPVDADDDVSGSELGEDEEAEDGAEDEAAASTSDTTGEAEIGAIAGAVGPAAAPAETAPEPEKIAVAPVAAAPVAKVPAAEVPAAPAAAGAAASVTAAVEGLIKDAAAPVELFVLRISHNPTMLFAHKGDRKELRVRVASNAHFLPGMKLNAQPPVKGGPDIWTMIGRCPRWRGRY